MHKIIHGDILNILPTLDDGYFDAVLTDPPYHLTSKGDPSKGFMNTKWDGGDIAFRKETWEAAKRVMKPGAFMLAFGGSRTYHRLVCAIEDSGMNIRDTLVWLYADSRPPNLDISKAIDRAKGASRKVVGKYQPPGMKGEWRLSNAKDERTVNTFASSRNNLEITAPETDESKLWDGYGTALKPSCELVSLSMKPMIGSYVENALSVGVCGLNISTTRIPVINEKLKGGAGGMLSNVRDKKPYSADNGYNPSPLGRWPKNVILDEGASTMIASSFPGVDRFFYCNKVSTRERNAGLPEGMINEHQTLKPLSLTTYLAKLCLPPPRSDGQPRRILVPFSGVGSEMAGAILAGWDEVIGIENGGGDEALALKHIAIAEARLEYWSKLDESQKSSIFD